MFFFNVFCICQSIYYYLQFYWSVTSLIPQDRKCLLTVINMQQSSRSNSFIILKYFCYIIFPGSISEIIFHASTFCSVAIYFFLINFVSPIYFRKKLTKLSVNANGSLVPKDCVDKTLIKKNLW